MSFPENPFQTKVGGQILNLRQDGLSNKVSTLVRQKYHLRKNRDHCFLSKSELKEIFSRIVVWHILHQQTTYPEHQLGDMVSQIMSPTGSQSSIQTFMILNIIEQVQYIRHFLSAKYYDKDLPLIYESEAYNSLLLLGCGEFELDSFCSTQWHVLVPVLNMTPNNIRRQTFMSEARMPFLEQKYQSRGGQGRILKVKIHTKHIHPTSSLGPYFAVKEFGLHQKRLWQDEVDALTKLSQSPFKDKHLIKLLCAYEHEDRGLFLIFPLANGNLLDYWALDSSRSRFAKGPRWLLEQCSGIAGGLSTIHLLATGSALKLGRHGDIKPGNILWFKSSNRDRGHLVLADFTSTRFHSRDSVDRPSTGTAGITRAYSPPEVDLDTKHSRTQAYDIWSLGCVYLEFLTWYLFGGNAVLQETFVHGCGETCHSFASLRLMDDHHNWRREDKFFNIIQQNGSAESIVKESVKKWIRMLHCSKQCSTALHAFLELIENSMIRVEPMDRMGIEQVSLRLNEILGRALDPGYCVVGCPSPVATIDDCHPLFVEEDRIEYQLGPRTRSSRI